MTAVLDNEQLAIDERVASMLAGAAEAREKWRENALLAVAAYRAYLEDEVTTFARYEAGLAERSDWIAVVKRMPRLPTDAEYAYARHVDERDRVALSLRLLPELERP